MELTITAKAVFLGAAALHDRRAGADVDPGKRSVTQRHLFSKHGWYNNRRIHRPAAQAGSLSDARSSVTLTALGIAAATLVMTLTALLLAPEGPFAISRAGSDLALEYQSRAEAAGLDGPVYWLARAFPDGSNADMGSVSARRDRSRWYVSARGKRATLGPTVGKGWTLLA